MAALVGMCCLFLNPAEGAPGAQQKGCRQAGIPGAAEEAAEAAAGGSQGSRAGGVQGPCVKLH